MPSITQILQRKGFRICTFFIAILLSKGIAAQTFTLADSAIMEGAVMISREIRFRLDAVVLEEESKPHLDSIAVFLLKHRNLVIEVGNHTDMRWSDAYSNRLTMNRAKEIVSYLILKGIEPDRLIARGYNDSRVLIPDSVIWKLPTEEEIEKAHWLNRRTEFRIERTDYGY